MYDVTFSNLLHIATSCTRALFRYTLNILSEIIATSRGYGN